ncbi:DUF3311 domain-containing protein [Amycolatopsis alkalitolerans]|uniref:DUF3311 domain-containing protein n=1 Tax=Amycolatopsis alkalitolerans TaxID=2547244 RepID=A0A5C4M4V4_9PSEU|nr:DUF3311 domain-containing protein [Amycolatopsis alkalitolerans]TNC26445.1 DUF3311 domain-containing protein [Amycolatopsis alkalitolerans]
MTTPRTRSRAGRHRHRLLLLVPYLWSVAAIPLVNSVHAAPLGVPLLLWWALAGVVVTTGCLGVVWRLDRAREVTGR